MATILVKNVPEALLKELRRLKVELACKTWAELLSRLVESERTITAGVQELNGVRAGVQGFLGLKRVVSSAWAGSPMVLEETRRSRDHVAT